MTDFCLRCPQSTVPLSQGYKLSNCLWWQNVIKPNQKGTWYDMNPQQLFTFKAIALLLLTYTFFWLPYIYIDVLPLMDAWPNTLRTEQTPPLVGFCFLGNASMFVPLAFHSIPHLQRKMAAGQLTAVTDGRLRVCVCFLPLLFLWGVSARPDQYSTTAWPLQLIW